jgi:hypothetical protein
MKSLIIVVLMTLFLIIVITIIFKITKSRRRAILLISLFLITLPIFVVIYLATPLNLWFLPPGLGEADSIVGIIFGLFVYTALFGGGVLQLYNLADRGFSLRILIDILESPVQELTLEEIFRDYGGGKGIDWMYQKRIDGMLDNQMIKMENDNINITHKGLRIAKYFSLMREFLNLQADYLGEDE